MAKYLLLIFVVLVVYLLVKKPVGRRTRQRRAHAESMVACAHCGLHIPESESVSDGALYYCSKLHLSEAKRRQ